MWGGHGGMGWDDGSFHGVRKISVIHGPCINAIRVVYHENGVDVEKDRHGEGSERDEATFELQSPGEFLECVSGHFGPVIRDGPLVIRSLTFKSSRGTYGPYGEERGTPFYFTVAGAKIVGFKGRSERRLNAIGFHSSKVSGMKQFMRRFLH